MATEGVKRFRGGLIDKLRLPIIGSVVIVLLVVGFVLIQVSRSALTQQIFRVQRKTAQEIALSIASYLEGAQERLIILEQTQDWSQLSRQGKERAIERLLESHQQTYEEIAFLDRAGDEVVKVSRFRTYLPEDLEARPHLTAFQRAVAGDSFLAEGITISPDSGAPVVQMAVPVREAEGSDSIGVLLANVSIEQMWDKIAEVEVGETGYTYVINKAGRLLAHSDTDRYMELQEEDLKYVSAVRKIVSRFEEFEPSHYEGLAGEMVVGAFAPIEGTYWFTIAELPRVEAYASLRRMTIFLASVLVVAVLIIGGLASWLPQRIIRNPLDRLREGAASLSSGDLGHRITLETGDELEALADTFNQMAAHLQELYADLEQKVVDRTRGLERRAVQLETAAEVARDAAAIHDVDELLEETVALISDKFGFYHAAIFLLDDTGQYAVLESASSPGGRRMLERGHRLEVGEKGIVGYVAEAVESRVALDVGKDAVHFVNPDLPETRSEMALPLVAGGEVIGVLDVQSTQVGAFDDEDVAILEVVADQLALAIENARLLEESRQAVREMRAARGDYIRTAWARLNQQAGFEYDRVSVRSVDPPSSSILHQALEAGEVVAMSNPEDQWAALSSPLRLRDQVIGVLSLEDADGREDWTEDEIELVEEVSEQVALALENTRLFQETREMAQRRALVNEVLQAASTSLEPENLLHKAAEAISTRLQIPSVVFMLDEGTLRPVAAHDAAAQDVAWPGEPAVAPEMDPTLFEAVRTKEVRLLDAINGRLRGPAARLADRLNLQASVYAPLISRGQVLGVLQMGRQAGQPDLLAEDVTFAELIAGNLSVGLESARLYQEAVDTAERLREVDRLKSQFLANMSHELRTPLNSIIGFSRVILKGIDGPVTDQQQEDLEAIHNSGQHLLGLINDILDISKIEAGKMELSFGPVDVEEVIEGVMSTAIALVKDKPVDLQHTVSDDLPTIEADERRVRQVLLNLVSNAAKFTDEGFIRVEAELDADEDQVIVSVADTGSGIPQEKIQEIFQPFTQVDGSSTRKHGGTGLGLAITNSFVEMHGGKLWVDSKVGEGSTFYFSLPIERPPAPDEEPEEVEEEIALESVLEEEGKLVLCVDDDEGVLTLFRRYLRKQGYQIVGLTDASRVLQEAKRLRPYAITLDVMMPEKDGWEIIRELKQDPETRDIPVVVCSIVSDKEKGMSLGAADYLVKPIVEDDLLKALERLDREAGVHNVLVVDDNEGDRDLLRRMMEAQEDYVVVEAAGGQEAIEQIKRSPPHIIILDLMMPEVDGFAVLETVKADPTTRHIPVIVVTAKDLTTEERQILNHRIDSLIQKGVLEQEDLLKDVVAALQRLDR